MIKHLYKKIILSIVGLTAATAFAVTPLTPAQNSFILMMKHRYHYHGPSLQQAFQAQQPNQTVLRIEHRPYTHKPWHLFSTQLLSPLRIKEGVAFMHRHRQALNDAYQHYGVDPYVIAAIVGIESTYARQMGHFNALNVLYTLAFYYPPREHYFQNELANFLVLTKDWPGSIHHVQSSFDGGLGVPQFMPSTYRHYAVPYLNHKYADLIHHPNDAIVSVANYLKKVGWHRHGFIAVPIQSTLDDSGGAPVCVYHHRHLNDNLQSLTAHGFLLPPNLPDQHYACVQLKDRKTMRYWAVGNNFSAIMGYNPQVYYAMVVYELSQAIRRASQA
jgi:membrane-bound lytic murein transglycosylase B